MATQSTIDPSLAVKLRDPAYLERHLVASHALHKASGFAWYDSLFLRCYDAANTYLAEISPQSLEAFRSGFAALHPSPDFAVPHMTDFLSPELLAEIRAEVAAIPAQKLETHELRAFGRNVVHNHPRFMRLQHELTERVSQIAGVPLEPGYNFLSLYGPDGDCGLHMDQPISMYTLDFCIDQSHEWPIQFSDVIDWSTDTRFDERPTPESLEAAGVTFAAKTLHPNEAILFCGSSQWHYRKPFKQDGFCSLLFLHYFPAGAGNLIRPTRWAEQFAMPELVPLCDLFEAAGLGVGQDYGKMA